MVIDLDILSNAYCKYSINQSSGNLQRLQQLTGTETLSEAVRVTQGMITKTCHIQPLNSFQQAISRLRRVHLIQGRAFSHEFQQLHETIQHRLKQIERRDMRKMQAHIFHLCCKILRERIVSRQTKIIGPSILNLYASAEFTEDIQPLLRLSGLSSRSEKLAHLTQNLLELQDKYMHGSAVESQIRQLLILCFVSLENPSLLLDLQDAQKGLDSEEVDGAQSNWVKHVTLAITSIYQEALPILEAHPPIDLQNIKTDALFRRKNEG